MHRAKSSCIPNSLANLLKPENANIRQLITEIPEKLLDQAVFKMTNSDGSVLLRFAEWILVWLIKAPKVRL
jgi:hypothetical protein